MSMRILEYPVIIGRLAKTEFRKADLHKQQLTYRLTLSNLLIVLYIFMYILFRKGLYYKLILL